MSYQVEFEPEALVDLVIDAPLELSYRSLTRRTYTMN
jgi:hypothetical protein